MYYMYYREENEKQLYEDAFGSHSYFIVTMGMTVIEKVNEYIDGRRTDNHKRKDEKSGKYAKKRKQS